MRKAFIAVAVIVAFAGSGSAGEECPCVPVAYQWIATPCASWNCAAAALVDANGNRNVVPIPTTSNDYSWVVLRRVVAGSAIVSPDAPFKVQSFDTLSDASSHYYTVSEELQPLLLTAPDGKVVVVSRANAEPKRRRTVTH